jgi:hypothetical protein
VTITYAQFVARHPEFAAPGVPEALVQGELDDAALEVDATVAGAETDKVIRLKAAEALARSPFGQQANLVDDEGKTPFTLSLKAAIDRLGGGYRAVLED